MHRSVKLAVNWRCVEYEQLISQIDLVPEYYEVVRVFTAWAHLYINLRYVAPTEESISLAYALYEHPCARFFN